jgi:hypothetical protein
LLRAYVKSVFLVRCLFIELDFKSVAKRGLYMKIDKVEISGIAVLFIGVALLVFAFFNAYAFLAGQLQILGSQDILKAFGEALAPLIEAIIRILYLGIMGWIGSILTIRGIQLLKMEKPAPSETRQKANPTKAHANAGKGKTAS